uniref:Uncharacterized protein n=1 Tax=Pseudodiaptomus poplesia TaxID=213370 RepID=A0A0U2UFX9_9MAXI|nr:hypothetical protein [Pseudodiaptomus poplesia]
MTSWWFPGLVQRKSTRRLKHSCVDTSLKTSQD